MAIPRVRVYRRAGSSPHTRYPRSRLLTDLGFSLPSGPDKVIGDKFGGNISAERISLLDQQALVWFPTKGGTAKLQNDPRYKNLNVRKQGRDVFVEENFDDQLYCATSFVSVLSLPIVLDQLVPKFSKASTAIPLPNGPLAPEGVEEVFDGRRNLAQSRG